MAGPSEAGVRFTLEVPGAKRVDVALSRFGDGLKDFTPFWRGYAAPLVFDRIERNFQTQGGFAGGWAPLTPNYAAWKAEHYPGKPILQRTGSLYASLQWHGGRVGPRGIADFTPSRATLGTSVEYGIYHQVGTHRMAKRQIIVPPDSETWGRLMHRYVTDQRRKAKLGQDAA